MTIKIGVNGFSRIGRACIRLVEEHPELEMVAFNSTRDPKMLAHLFMTHSTDARPTM